MIKKLFLAFLFAGALAMLFMSLDYFQHRVAGVMNGKEIASGLWYRTLLRTHILFGICGILVGPFQFVTRLRVKRPELHKKLGYAYVISIFLSGLAGLIVAQFAMGGWIAALGFSMLAIVWLITTGVSVRSIVRGNIRSHKLFMMLSYALTFAAIPQRTMLLLDFVTDIPFMTIYKYSAWLPWMLSLGIAYTLFLYSERSKKSANVY